MGYSRDVTESLWYSQLREQWRPARVRLLLIGESAPDSGTNPELRRFFYAPTLSRADNLFRGVVDAMYSASGLKVGTSKEPWLRRLQEDGVWLIDLVPYPVNKLGAGERRRALREHASDCVSRAIAIAPDGVIVCHAPSFDVLKGLLRAADVPLLHNQRIPFPLGNTRAAFVAGFRQAVAEVEPA